MATRTTGPRPPWVAAGTVRSFTDPETKSYRIDRNTRTTALRCQCGAFIFQDAEVPDGHVPQQVKWCKHLTAFEKSHTILPAVAQRHVLQEVVVDLQQERFSVRRAISFAGVTPDAGARSSQGVSLEIRVGDWLLSGIAGELRVVRSTQELQYWRGQIGKVREVRSADGRVQKVR